MQTFSQEFIDEGAKRPVLGPAYFDARAVAKRIMEGFQADQFEPVLKSLVDEAYSKLLDAVQSHLMSDAEINIQGEIWRMVDASVKALLTGERWALERHALGDRYDHDKLREAVAKHVPVELQDKRIADLEAEVKRLADDNRSLRSNY